MEQIKLPVVEVTWLDARWRGKNDPVSVAKNDKAYMRRTVGYLVNRDKTKVVLAMTYDNDQDSGEEHEVDDRLTVPLRMVKKVRYLRK